MLQSAPVHHRHQVRLKVTHTGWVNTLLSTDT